jgi:hypothetical protein
LGAVDRLCGKNCVSRLQININIVVDELIPRGMQHIEKLVDVLKYSVFLKKLQYLFARQSFVHFITFHAKHGKLRFAVHFYNLLIRQDSKLYHCSIPVPTGSNLNTIWQLLRMDGADKFRANGKVLSEQIGTAKILVPKQSFVGIHDVRHGRTYRGEVAPFLRRDGVGCGYHSQSSKQTSKGRCQWQRPFFAQHHGGAVGAGQMRFVPWKISNFFKN